LKTTTAKRIVNILREAVTGWTEHAAGPEALGKQKELADALLDCFARHARRVLRKCPEPTSEELEQLTIILKQLPYLIRREAPEVIRKSLPHAPGGHIPSLTAKQRREVCQELLNLHGKEGLTFRDAARRVALRNHVSTRTIERAWKERREWLKRPGPRAKAKADSGPKAWRDAAGPELALISLVVGVLIPFVAKLCVGGGAL